MNGSGGGGGGGHWQHYTAQQCVCVGRVQWITNRFTTTTTSLNCYYPRPVSALLLLLQSGNSPVFSSFLPIFSFLFPSFLLVLLTDTLPRTLPHEYGSSGSSRTNCQHATAAAAAELGFAAIATAATATLDLTTVLPILPPPPTAAEEIRFHGGDHHQPQQQKQKRQQQQHRRSIDVSVWLPLMAGRGYCH